MLFSALIRNFATNKTITHLNDYLQQLNPQQAAAVTYCDGPQLVIAGAGSGKTRVLTYKIVHLLNSGYSPYNIMALTFTNKAARTMRERILSLTSPEVASKLWMGTFHSIFAKILRFNAERIGFKSDYTIYDANDSKTLIKQIIKDKSLDDKVYKPSTVQNIISMAKNNLMTPADYENCAQLIEADKIAKRPKTHEIYRTYCARCRVAGAMDFDDILLYMNILLRDNPDVLDRYRNFFQYVLVDEYQDTNFAQHMIILQLTRKKGNLFVVGDDAQSIYSFRGAKIENILRIREAYPNIEIFKLEHNYRSTKNIIEAANSLIDKNKNQIKKHSFTENPQGSKVNIIQSYSDYEESYVVANQIVSIKSRYGDSLNDFAVLYRTNAQSRILEEALRKRNLAYRIYGGLSFYQRKEIKDAVCYFRLTINPDDDEALRRVINYPTRGIGDTTVNKIQHCAITNNVSMWQVICDPAKYELPANAATLKKLAAFHDLIGGLVTENQQNLDAYTITRSIIMKSGLYALTNCDNTPENISKRENLEELVNSASAFVEMRKEEGYDDLRLTSFLAEISLATDQDEESKEAGGPKVTLMTVHAAKGLEFKNVIVVGVEEELFPAQMSSDTLAHIEEERRLLYVAITRAMNTCTITYASSRYKNGQTKLCSPSRFLREIDSAYTSLLQTGSSAGANYNPFANNRDLWKDAREQNKGNEVTFHTRREPLPHYPKPKKEHNDQGIPSTTTEPPKNFVAVSKAKESTTPASGTDAFAHDTNEIAVGTKIRHIRFGIGEITDINTTGSDTKIIVNFEDNGTRTLLLKFAKFEIIK